MKFGEALQGGTKLSHVQIRVRAKIGAAFRDHLSPTTSFDAVKTKCQAKDILDACATRHELNDFIYY